MTPLSFETAFMPASLPGVNFTCFSSVPADYPRMLALAESTSSR